MPRSAAFQEHCRRYETWFEKHQAAYISELLALRPFVPWTGRGIEIGVGSGRFAAPLGVHVGVDPSSAMLDLAAQRGIRAVKGTAEQLPFTGAGFDYALLVTTICFVDSPTVMPAEVHRVLRPGGQLTIGFIDRGTLLGQEYLAHRDESMFYHDATFFSAEEVAQLLLEAGFTIHAWGQTLAHPLPATRKIEPLRPGVGQCAFVVVAALRQ